MFKVGVKIVSNMLGKRAQQRYGYAGRHCQCCNIDRAAREHKHSARQSEAREWRKDAHELPQGDSWLQDQFEAHTMNDGYWRWDDERLDDLPYWLAIKCLDAIHDGPDLLPPGFDGVWSTDSAHVMLMRKRNRMNRVHDGLRELSRASDGNRYAQAIVKHPRFERVVI